MASNTVFKAERDNGYKDADPLAELSRIMGMDQPHGASTEDNLDFAIDLEQELLSDLASDYAQPSDASRAALTDTAARDMPSDPETVPSVASVDQDIPSPSDDDLQAFDRAFADLSFGLDSAASIQDPAGATGTVGPDGSQPVAEFDTPSVSVDDEDSGFEFDLENELSAEMMAGAVAPAPETVSEAPTFDVGLGADVSVAEAVLTEDSSGYDLDSSTLELDLDSELAAQFEEEYAAPEIDADMYPVQSPEHAASASHAEPELLAGDLSELDRDLGDEFMAIENDHAQPVLDADTFAGASDEDRTVDAPASETLSIASDATLADEFSAEMDLNEGDLDLDDFSFATETDTQAEQQPTQTAMPAALSLEDELSMLLDTGDVAPEPAPEAAIADEDGRQALGTPADAGDWGMQSQDFTPSAEADFGAPFAQQPHEGSALLDDDGDARFAAQLEDIVADGRDVEPTSAFDVADNQGAGDGAWHSEPVSMEAGEDVEAVDFAGGMEASPLGHPETESVDDVAFDLDDFQIEDDWSRDASTPVTQDWSAHGDPQLEEAASAGSAEVWNVPTSSDPSASHWPGFTADASRTDNATAPPEPAPAVDDADPFAALAALAAAPPILKSLGRANPVALQPNAERSLRAEQPAPAGMAAPSMSPPPSVARAPEPRPEAAPTANPIGGAAHAASPSVQPRSLASRLAQPAAAAPLEPRPAPSVAAAAPVQAPAGHYSSYPSFVPKTGQPPSQAGMGGFAAAASAGYAGAAGFAAQPSTFAPAASTSAPAELRGFEPAYSRPAAAPAAPREDEFDDLDLLLDEELSPFVETQDLPHEPVALADDFDIPELAADEPLPRPPEFDEFEAEFTNVFGANHYSQDPPRAWHAEPAAPLTRRSVPDDFAPEPAAPARTVVEDQLSGMDYELDASLAEFDSSAFASDDAYALGQGFTDEEGFEEEFLEREEPRSRRGLLIASVVAAVAIVGGLGAVAMWMGGGDSSDVPALVRADPGPVKVRPENPGGVVVPNQDGTVYERVAGKAPSDPSQERLISGSEEPIEPESAVVEPTAAPPAAELPGVDGAQIKSEDRVLPAETADAPPAENNNVAIMPTKVRTMIVRPDGTLVPREDPPEPAAAVAAPVSPPVTGTVPQADPLTVAAATPAPPVPSAVDGAADDVTILPPDSDSDLPGAAAVPADVDFVPMARPARPDAPARTVAAPVQPVAQPVQPAQVPVVEPAPVELAGGPAVAGGWSVQIASQPTREGAQASYVDLARRYASLLDGKGVNIVAAEIQGRGTMWRVRVPAATRNDANILCAKLKTAGASCFVSQ